MTICQASQPPPGATCGNASCGSVSVVRVAIRPPQSTAGGFAQDSGGAPMTRDACELHWPAFRDSCARDGYVVTDVTGDVRALAAELPGWRVFTSDGGRLYASTVLPGGQGVTVDAFLAGHLRAQMREIEDTKVAAGDAR